MTTQRPKIYIDRQLFYPMNAAGFIQFAKDKTMILCIPGIPEAQVFVGEKPASVTQQGQNSKTRVTLERDAYGELDESRDDLCCRPDPFAHLCRSPSPLAL
jgi:hypothetical protein